MWELTKTFRFEAAHTLHRHGGLGAGEVGSSRRIHGHSYRAEVTVRGAPAVDTGMILDLSLFEAALNSAEDGLDHRFLDEVEGLGPATMENLSRWIWDHVSTTLEGLFRVTVYRDSQGEVCSYYGLAA